MKHSVAIGVDLGGTKTEAVVVQARSQGPEEVEELEVIERMRVPTPREQGYRAIVDGTATLIETVARAAGIDGTKVPIGVGMPGSVTRRQGLVKNSNTVCLNGQPFRQDLTRRLGRNVVFDNDANCFALAETLLGAARPWRQGIVFGVILGTGVGGGVVLHGKVWEGAQGIAGEWGHHPVRFDPHRRCYCGQYGCLELYASGPAVENDYALRSGTRRPLADIAARRPSDVHAQEAIEGLLEAFGRGLATVIDILDPSAVVLGGGVSNLEVLYSDGVERVRRYVFNDELVTPVLRNALGDSAGVLGAALRALMAETVAGTAPEC